MAAVIGDDAAKGINVGGGEGSAVVAEGRPGIPWGAEEAAGDAVARGGEQPFDAVEGTGESGVGAGVGGGGSQNEGGCFLFLGGGVFGGADDAGAEGEHFVGEAGVDRAASEGVDIEGLVAIFVRDGFDEADEARKDRAMGFLLREMERSAAEMGSQLLVVYLPTNYWGPPAGLAKVIGNIRLLDLTQSFHRNREAGGPNPYIVGDGHPSADGNALIAREIAAYIRREGLLK